ncbi:MAG: HIRAN domain-containing protein [Bacillota bacterium]|nr:HIRAN domain-containing protein [Bacillota bacterium]
MSNDLVVNKNDLIQAIEDKSVSDIIKPLVNEIHLFDTFIAGTTHLEDQSVLDEVAEGDKVNLRREENKFDEKAILVQDQNGRKLGYIPEKDNLIFSRLMDAGKLLIGKVSDIQLHGTFHKIKIGIYLVDY